MPNQIPYSAESVLSRIKDLAQQDSIALFRAAESIGLHVLPVHFYSPVPCLSSIPEDHWDRQLELGFSQDAQLGLIRELEPYVKELAEVPTVAPDGQLHWRNPMFCGIDMAIYYAILRRFRSSRVLEVGSGHSALVAQQAAKTQTLRIEAIEPYPVPWLKDSVDTLIQSPVQTVSLDRFRCLEEGDTLLIDSTHVSKIGSDVNYLFLEVLPSVRPGVLVHIHDVFLPFDYPKDWIVDLCLLWNEQYLLAALLTAGDSWEVLSANYWLGKNFGHELARLLPYPDVPLGTSFWMRKRSQSK